MSKLNREWYFYIEDMISFAEKVIVYTEGYSQSEFVFSGLNYDATVRNLDLSSIIQTDIPSLLQELSFLQQEITSKP